METVPLKRRQRKTEGSSDPLSTFNKRFSNGPEKDHFIQNYGKKQTEEVPSKLKKR